MKCLRISQSLLINLVEYLDCLIQGLLGLCLCRLHHQRLMYNQREVHGRRMNAVVQKCLGNIHGIHVLVVFHLLQTHDELMHAGLAVGHVIDIRQLHPHIVGIQHRVAGSLRYALLSKGQDIGQCLNHHQEVAVEHLHIPNGFLRLHKVICILLLLHTYAGYKGL